ncbi:MAG: hypothetical protein U0599_18500 [Vicinamibacteria bacterium]
MSLRFLAGAVGALALACPGALVAAVTIDHGAVGCVVAERFPRFEARFDPAAEVSRARVHFRPAGGAHWYSVTMKAEAGVFAAAIPKPRPTLARIDYYIEATDRAFGTARTAEFSPAVESGALACREKPAAGALGSASVVIEAPPGAPPIPLGFSPDGVVSMPSSASDAGPAASPGTGTSATSAIGKSGGHGKALLIGGGAAVAVGVGVAAAGGSSSGSGASGGGSSTAGGGSAAPCVATPITASLSSVSSPTRCGQPIAAGIVVKNGACVPITIRSIQLTQTATAATFCSAQVATYTYVPTVSTVGAGQTVTVLNYTSQPFCCTGGACPGVSNCPYDEAFVVQTSEGPVAAGSVPLVVSFDPSCPICAP